MENSPLHTYAVPPHTRRTATACPHAVFLSLLCLLLSACKPTRTTVFAPEPPTVETITVAAADIPVTHEWVATLDGSTNAIIRPQVSGYILRQVYTDGSVVRKGDLLFEIDPRPFKAALEQARASLAQAQAQAGKTALDVKRYTPLAATEAISKQELDDAIQADLAAKAAVAAAQAQVEQASIDLGFTKVTAPIDGVAGQSKVQIGDLVNALSLELTTISTVNPIRAYFSPSEQEYLRYKETHQSSASDNTPLPLTLILSDGTRHPETGRVEFVDRQVDSTTGAIRISTLFPNPGNTLRPGMFARLRAVTGVHRGAVAVPQRAIIEMQGAYQVLVYSPDTGTATVRPVKVGERIGPRRVVLDGLKPGEQVIVEGLQKARPGVPLKTKPYAPTSASAAQSD